MGKVDIPKLPDIATPVFAVVNDENDENEGAEKEPEQPEA